MAAQQRHRLPSASFGVINHLLIFNYCTMENNPNKLVTLEALVYYDEKIKAYVEALIEAVNGDISAIPALVSTLIGNDSGKSVRTIANEELAEQLIPENAKEALDTLQEIAAWIQSHPEDAAEFNKRIGDLETSVGAPADGDNPATGFYKVVSDSLSYVTTADIDAIFDSSDAEE